MSPSWGGVLGGALTEGANAYLRTVLDEPYERIRKRKAELELDRLESQIAYDKARAGWEARRGAQPDYLKTSWGLYRKDPETGQYELVYEKPPKELKPEEEFQSTVIDTITKRLGKPRDQWTAEDLLRPDVRPLIDLVQKRSDIIVVPGWGPQSAEDIRKKLQEGQQPQAPPPATPGPQTTRPPGAPQPQPRTTPPTSQAPPSVTPGRGTRDLLPMVEGYMVEYDKLDDSGLQSAMNRLSEAQAETPSPVIEAQLMAIGRIMARRRRPPQPAPGTQTPPGRRSSLLEEEAVPQRYVSTYADTMQRITPQGALQLVSQLQSRSPDALLSRAAAAAYDRVYGQAGAAEPDAAALLATSWPETAVQPRALTSPDAAALTRVAQAQPGGLTNWGVPPGQEAQARERSDLAHRLARELFPNDPFERLSAQQMQELNRELLRREAQGKQKYEDELNNTRPLQDVRPNDYDRFYYRSTGQPVPGTMPYGAVKALQNDPDVETSVVHLTTDNAKQLTVLKLLEPTLKAYSNLIEYAYHPDGPLGEFRREPLPIATAMIRQFMQTDPGLQALRRAVEGQLQSLVRALGSRGDLNQQELQMATNLIANMDASMGLGFTGGLGVGIGGGGRVGPMVGFKPTISIPDTPRQGVQIANELIDLVNDRLGTLLQHPGYAVTKRVSVPASRRVNLYGMPSAEKLEEAVEEEMGPRLRQLREHQLTAPGWRWPWESLEERQGP